MSFWTRIVSATTFLTLIRSRSGCGLRLPRPSQYPKAKSSMRIIFTLVVLSAMVSTAVFAQTVNLLNDGVVSTSTNPTAEVSTNKLKAILADKSARVFDARPTGEYAMSHIPGALNVAQKPGTPISEYISDADEIERIVGDKKAPIILYCNGPFCGKTKRLAQDLLDAGFTNVSRYQAGAPVWRALGGTMQIEASAVREVWVNDSTSRIYDARPETDRPGGIIPRSIVLTVNEVIAAKDDGRLPMEDHNTRIICFGETGSQAKALAEEISRNSFHNVTFFDGNAEQFREAIFHETGRGMTNKQIDGKSK
jgi:rhodanese-related sulfurtransferase